MQLLGDGDEKKDAVTLLKGKGFIDKWSTYHIYKNKRYIEHTHANQKMGKHTMGHFTEDDTECK